MGMLQTPKRQLHHVEAAPFTRKVCMVKADVMETILYGVCVMYTPGKEHFADLRRQHHVFLRTIGVQRRQHTDHVTPYARALKKAQCKSIDTTVRKRRPFFAGC